MTEKDTATKTNSPKKKNTTPDEKAAGQEKKHVQINAQYVKDLSFENPKAPTSLTSIKERPQIDFGINVAAKNIQETLFEVTLEINAKASAKDESIFVVELAYSGVFTLSGFGEEEQELALLVYCPSMLFPFARRVIADVTRDGGFPPLMMEPIDFGRLHAERAKQAQAKKKAAS